MAANQRWVTRARDGWRVVSSLDDPMQPIEWVTYDSEEDALRAARADLLVTGGGVLTIHRDSGRDVRTETVDTSGRPRPGNTDRHP